MPQDYPVLVKKVEPPMLFPEFNAELRKIGGTTPDGRNRLVLEWMGTATRKLNGEDVSKKGFDMFIEHLGYSLPGDPTAENPADRIDYDVETKDLNEVPREQRVFSTGKLRLAIPRIYYVDIPTPNFWISDWISPEKMYANRGAVDPQYREGYYHPVIPIHDPKRPDLMFYRHPDGHDLTMAREYQRIKETELLNLNRHFDQPLTANDQEVTNSWLRKAILHAKEEARMERVEEIRGDLEKMSNAEREEVCSVLSGERRRL
jgi:hypothetical protein